MKIIPTNLQAFSLKAEHAANISLVLLNFNDVHGVVKFINDLIGFGECVLVDNASFRL
jgi:hypothetical protein